MSSPLVSFCFTTFRRQELFRKTLLSVQKQTFPDFEVVVSDNDPEQMGRPIVEGMNDPRFKYFPNGENLGMKKSFNKSLERSSGKFVVMIADDDPVYPDMLETLINLTKAHPDYGLYMGGSDWFCTNPKVAELYKLNVGTNSFLSNSHELGSVSLFNPSDFLINFYGLKIFKSYLWSTCLVKRDVLLEMGAIPDYGTAFLGDYTYLGLMGAHSGAVVINQSLGHQTIHAQNFGRGQNEQIAVAARNVPAYLEKYLAPRGLWTAEIKNAIWRFTGLWVIGHLSFLYNYSDQIDKESLDKAANEVFEIDYMKQFRLKYFLKRNFPNLHNTIVLIKKKIG